MAAMSSIILGSLAVGAMGYGAYQQKRGVDISQAASRKAIKQARANAAEEKARNAAATMAAQAASDEEARKRRVTAETSGRDSTINPGGYDAGASSVGAMVKRRSLGGY